MQGDEQMGQRDEYYKRVLPIVGTHLNHMGIQVYDLPFLSKAVELLISCGALQFGFSDLSTPEPDIIHRVWGINQDSPFTDTFVRRMKSHNEFEDRFQLSSGLLTLPSIVLGGGTLEMCHTAYERGAQTGVPTVCGMLLKGGCSIITVMMPDESYPWSNLPLDPEFDIQRSYLDWIDLNNQVAHIAKAVLLIGTSREPEDTTALLKSGKTTVLVNHPSWPWVSRYGNLHDGGELAWLTSAIETARGQEIQKYRDAPMLSEKTVMIVGIGSLGSLIAEHFRNLDANIMGIDGKDVSLHNPVRQLYPTSAIGQKKAFALAKLLAEQGGECQIDRQTDHLIVSKQGGQFFWGEIEEIPDSADGRDRFVALLSMLSPDLVVLTTAHPAEFRMADELRKQDIPHVIGRCYPRARWFEATVVDGENGPCFGCLQGHLYTGILPSLTEEELARYEESSGEEEESGMLDAEPATRVDTSHCADAVTRLGLQLLTPSEQRAEWFRRMLREERPCLIGGNHAEYQQEQDGWSFGITTPGTAKLFGVINFVGSETQSTTQCLYCGKIHNILIHRRRHETI